MLPCPSSEQTCIIECLRPDQNVCVDSVAGSGKTTTNLHIARAYPQSQILLLTYNANLRLETRNKVSGLGIKNMEVHTYHSYCVAYYDSGAFTEPVFRNAVKTKPSSNSCIYDIIIIDEAQDMNRDYFQLVWRILMDSDNRKTKLCVVGDRNQSIYGFAGANARFLTLCDRLFTYNAFPWARCALHTSFRITNSMSHFINDCMLESPRIFSDKKGVQPKYIVCDPFERTTANRIYSEIGHYLDNGYLPRDIFVLAPSIQIKKYSGKSPITILENLLKLIFHKERPEVGIYISDSENTKVDENVLKNKMIFSSFAKSKGLERKVVFVYNFDASYFQFYNSVDTATICPNVFYVACTRASEHLILIHGKQSGYLPFLSATNRLPDYCQNIMCSPIKTKKKLDDIPDIIRKSVTELLNNIRDIAQYVDQFKVTFLREAADLINIPIVTSQPNNLYEDVSGITGTCIPASYLDNFDSVYDQLIKIKNRETTDEARNNTKDIFFLKLSKHIDKVVAMKENRNRNKNGRGRGRGHGHGHESDNENENENEIENEIEIEEEYGAEEALQITNIMMACHTNMIHKVLQIKQYDWMSPQSFHASKERIRSLGIRQYDRTKITSSKSEYLVNGIIEIPQQDISKLREKYTFDERHLERIHDIHGYIDCVCEDTQAIYEFKFASILTSEHYLQLAMYGYLYHVKHPEAPVKKLFLYNIRSDELIQIEVGMDVMKKIMQDIVFNKMVTIKEMDDDAFVNDIHEIKIAMESAPHTLHKRARVFGSYS
jgi:AAA domain